MIAEETNLTPEITDYIKAQTSKYKNPSDLGKILEEVTQITTIGGVKDLVDKVYPEWFVTTMNSFCTDYPHLQKNWHTICNKIGVPLAQIMIVEETEEGDDYTLIRQFAECFTKAGFAVRRKMEYIPCEKCACAVPTEQLYQHLKKNKFTVPEKWDKLCQKCIE